MAEMIPPSRIAPPRSRLTNTVAKPSSSRFSSLMAPTAASIRRSAAPSLSRSSSKVSSISPATSKIGNYNNVPSTSTKTSSNFTSRQSSLASSTSAHVATVRKPPVQTNKSTYIPDTNSIRRGLAKFQNPIECQRQFQILNSEKRQLNEIIDNKDKQITRLQEQLDEILKKGVGYATVVQYFARKLKIDSEGLDLESECQQLKLKVEELLKNESEYESRLEASVEDYKNRIQLEQDLKENTKRDLQETREAHSTELKRILDAHNNELNDLINQHSALKQELENSIKNLELELKTRTKELTELRKEHEILNDNYNKLEDSLTKDKDARVKYVQDKANQLQKEVDSLNSVLEMRTERMHSLEKDSILLEEAQQELMTVKDNNKALKQQLESMSAALEIKREKYEILLADSEKIAQELKRERKERRRMTMRTEQLEYALNESFTTENNVTLHDPERVES